MCSEISEIIKYICTEENEGQRLDIAASQAAADMTRSAVQKLIENEKVLLNGEICTGKKTKVRAGDEITVHVPEPVLLKAEAEDIPLDIVYEDSDVLVVNKPRGMVVHPAAGNYNGTLVNAIMFHCGDKLSSINGVIRPGIVHRIDKDTSGLLVVAKNDSAHRSLARQLEEHSITRRYKAIVYNNIKDDEGMIDAPIGRDPGNRLRKAVVTGGKKAITNYRVLERFGRFTLIEAILQTGRTHQIRVHMSYIKHPLLGDELYGPKKNQFGIHGQLLHAGVLGFIHPSTGEYMEFESPLPDVFEDVLEKLRR